MRLSPKDVPYSLASSSALNSARVLMPETLRTATKWVAALKMVSSYDVVNFIIKPTLLI